MFSTVVSIPADLYCNSNSYVTYGTKCFRMGFKWNGFKMSLHLFFTFQLSNNGIHGMKQDDNDDNTGDVGPFSLRHLAKILLK